MSYFLTKYIFPIEQQFEISNVLKISFDNARSIDEINSIKEFISNSLQFSFDKKEQSNHDLFRKLKFGIAELIKNIEKSDEFAYKYYSENTKKNLIDILAETWIIVRYENLEFEKVAKSSEKLIDLMFKIDEFSLKRSKIKSTIIM